MSDGGKSLKGREGGRGDSKKEESEKGVEEKERGICVGIKSVEDPTETYTYTQGESVPCSSQGDAHTHTHTQTYDTHAHTASVT